MICGKRPKRLRIIATSDLHGHFTTSSEGSMEDAASIASSFRAIGDETLLLDCGDMLTDSAEGWYFSLPGHEKILEELISNAGYDALVPGNHDLQRALTLTKLPYTACNINGCASVHPYILSVRGDIKVAIIGAITAETRAFPDGIWIMPPAESMRHTIDNVIRHHNPDVTIGIIHAGREETEEILRAVPELTVAIYGHDHIPAIFTTPSGTVAINPGKQGMNVVDCILENGEHNCRLTPIGNTGSNQAGLIPDHIRSDINNTINAVITHDGDDFLRHSLHDVIRREVPDADVTAIYPLPETAERLAGISADILYNILPYDDYAGRWRMTGKELRESCLDLMTHDGSGELKDNRIYTVGVDCHTFPAASQASPLSLQQLLLEYLAKKECR